MEQTGCHDNPGTLDKESAALAEEPASNGKTDLCTNDVVDSSTKQADSDDISDNVHEDAGHRTFLGGSRAATVSLHRCVLQDCCGGRVHCPFCDLRQYKPAQPSRVCDHLQVSHFQHAVYYDGLMVVKCFQTCRGEFKGGHYHCPVCSTTLLKRTAFGRHLSSHATSQGLGSEAVQAPDAKKPEAVYFGDCKTELCRNRCPKTTEPHFHCPLCRHTCRQLSALATHLWRCKKRAVAMAVLPWRRGTEGDTPGSNLDVAKLFSPEMVQSVPHLKDCGEYTWHLSVVRNLSDLPLRRCDLEDCCKGRYHCPLCSPLKLKPNHRCHVKTHFLSHWRSGVKFKDYTALVCYLPCQEVAGSHAVRFHYHCPLCGATRRRRKTFARHLDICRLSPEVGGHDAEVMEWEEEEDEEEEGVECMEFNSTSADPAFAPPYDSGSARPSQHAAFTAASRRASADVAELQAAQSLAQMERIVRESLGKAPLGPSVGMETCAQESLGKAPLGPSVGMETCAQESLGKAPLGPSVVMETCAQDSHAVPAESAETDMLSPGRLNTGNTLDTDHQNTENTLDTDHQNTENTLNTDHQNTENTLDTDHQNTENTLNTDHQNTENTLDTDHQNTENTLNTDHQNTENGPQCDHLNAETKPNTDHLSIERRPNIDHLNSENMPNTNHLNAENIPNTDHLTAENSPNTDHLDTENTPNIDHMSAENKPNTDNSDTISTPNTTTTDHLNTENTSNTDHLNTENTTTTDHLNTEITPNTDHPNTENTTTTDHLNTENTTTTDHLNTENTPISDSRAADPAIMEDGVSTQPLPPLEVDAAMDAAVQLKLSQSRKIDNMQIFQQVSSQIPDDIASLLQSSGGLEESLHAIGRFSQVAWQRQGASVTMTCDLEELCYVQTCLKKILKDGLQSFLDWPPAKPSPPPAQPSTTTTTTTTTTTGRKRGRPRGSGKKRKAEQDPSPSDATGSLEKTTSADSSTSALPLATGGDIEVGLTPGRYSGRTRGKRIDFAKLNSCGEVSLGGDEAARDEVEVVTRPAVSLPVTRPAVSLPVSADPQAPATKRSRGRPRKVKPDQNQAETQQGTSPSQIPPKERSDGNTSSTGVETAVTGEGTAQTGEGTAQTGKGTAQTGEGTAQTGERTAQRGERSGSEQRATTQAGEERTGMGETAGVTCSTSSVAVGRETGSSTTADKATTTTTPSGVQHDQTSHNRGAFRSGNHGSSSVITDSPVEGKEERAALPRIPVTAGRGKGAARARLGVSDFAIIPDIVFDMAAEMAVDEEEEEGFEPATTQDGDAEAEAADSSSVSGPRKTTTGEREAVDEADRVKVKDDVEANVDQGHRCPLCGSNHATFDLLSGHMSATHPDTPSLTCDVCQVVCGTAGALAAHLERRHGPRPQPQGQRAGQGQTCKCSKCGKFCVSAASLRWHRTLVHKEGGGQRGRSRLRCVTCDYVAIDRWDMRQHRQQHGAAAVSCTVCKKALSTEAALKVHMEARHAGESYSCQVCGKTFAHLRYLRGHLQRHGGEKKHVCPLCGWRFHQTNSLQAHMDTHKPRAQRKYAYRCALCPAAYNSRANWLDHQNKHTGARPHQCGRCGKAFAFRSMLTQHSIFVHSSQRPHACGECHKQYKTKSQLRQHTMTHSMARTGTSPFMCGKCARPMASKSRLTAHLARCKGANSYKVQTLDLVSAQSLNISSPVVDLLPGQRINILHRGFGNNATITLVPVQNDGSGGTQGRGHTALLKSALEAGGGSQPLVLKGEDGGELMLSVSSSSLLPPTSLLSAVQPGCVVGRESGTVYSMASVSSSEAGSVPSFLPTVTQTGYSVAQSEPSAYNSVAQSEPSVYSVVQSEPSVYGIDQSELSVGSLQSVLDVATTVHVLSDNSNNNVAGRQAVFLRNPDGSGGQSVMSSVHQTARHLLPAGGVSVGEEETEGGEGESGSPASMDHSQHMVAMQQLVLGDGSPPELGAQGMSSSHQIVLHPDGSQSELSTQNMSGSSQQIVLHADGSQSELSTQNMSGSQQIVLHSDGSQSELSAQSSSGCHHQSELSTQQTGVGLGGSHQLVFSDGFGRTQTVLVPEEMVKQEVVVIQTEDGQHSVLDLDLSSVHILPADASAVEDVRVQLDSTGQGVPMLDSSGQEVPMLGSSGQGVPMLGGPEPTDEDSGMPVKEEEADACRSMALDENETDESQSGERGEVGWGERGEVELGERGEVELGEREEVGLGEAGGGEIYMCSTCSQQFDNMTAAEQHVLSQHADTAGDV